MKKPRNTTVTEAAASMRRSAYEAKVAAMREGRMPQRAVTFPDRRKVASKKACRGRVEH